MILERWSHLPELLPLFFSFSSDVTNKLPFQSCLQYGNECSFKRTPPSFRACAFQSCLQYGNECSSPKELHQEIAQRFPGLTQPDKLLASLTAEACRERLTVTTLGTYPVARSHSYFPSPIQSHGRQRAGRMRALPPLFWN